MFWLSYESFSILCNVFNVMFQFFLCDVFDVFVWCFLKQLWCYHCKHCNYVKPKTVWARTQLDFPLGYWIWVVKYKAILWLKNYQEKVKTHKIDNSYLKASLGSFMKKVTKRPFSSFPVSQGRKTQRQMI